jgi:hypothetical protein
MVPSTSCGGKGEGEGDGNDEGEDEDEDEGEDEDEVDGHNDGDSDNDNNGNGADLHLAQDHVTLTVDGVLGVGAVGKDVGEDVHGLRDVLLVHL